MGEFVDSDTFVMTLARLDPLHVEAFVDVAYWGRIDVGSTGAIVLRAPLEGEYEGTVTVVDRVFDAASGTFGVRLELPNADRRLPAGQRCTVRFVLPGDDAAR